MQLLSARGSVTAQAGVPPAPPAYYPPPPPVPPRPPQPPRERSVLGVVTFCSVLVVTGLMLLWNTADDGSADDFRAVAVLGTALGVTAIGPLVGGLLTEHLSWHWIFYINIPVGLVALIVTSSALRMQVHRREHTIDYLGAGLIVASVSAMLLLSTARGSCRIDGTSFIPLLILSVV